MSDARPGVGRQIIGYAFLAAGFVLGGVGAIAGALAAASMVAVPAAVLFAGLAAGAVTTLLTTYLAAWMLGSRRRRTTAIVGASLLAVIVTGLTTIFLLPPLADEVDPTSRPLPPGATYWDLSTGSRVAVLKIDARGAVKAPPVIFLHGGPGAYSVALTPAVDALSALAGDGHDVYFYDQIGGGLSARLDDVALYSLDRHLADLDAIRARTGAEKIVLIASSFGASLGANYIARHPEHVAAAVFSGAGPLFHPAWKARGDGKLDEVLTPTQRARLAQAIEKPRLFAAIILAEINADAAARFAPDAELGPFFDRVANEFYLPATVCAGRSPNVRSDGYGFWSNRMTTKTLWRRSDDPRPRLREVATPVLILRGVCDYKKEAVAREYADVFANARFHLIEGAGHMLYLEKPDEYLGYVRRFLNEVRESGTVR